MNHKLLVECRKKNNFSQEQIAKLLGYKSKASYSLLESGETKMTIELASKLINILKLNQQQIINIFFDKIV